MKLRRFFIRTLLLAVLGSLLWVYWAGRELAEVPRLQADVSRILIPGASESFADFRQRANEVIALIVPPAFPEETLTWRLPFEQSAAAGCDPARDRGILLFHGLTDSPFSLRDVADKLSAHCQTVRVMLLPGHATVPGDLSVATLEDWRLTVDRSVTAFRKQYPDMLLGGYSLGGALAVDYVHRHPDMPPAGLVLIAPALDLDSGALWALPILNAASTGLPRLAWLEIHSDDNPVKYESFPVNGAWQMARLSDELRTVPVKARLPVWGALTADDATVNAPASLVHLCQLAATDGRSRLIWYGSKPPKQGCDAVEWQKTADGVLDYSHLALPFKPDNAVYGVRPLYYNCVHYPAYGLQWRLCKGLEAVGWQVTPALGEITKSNLQLPVLRRLTYNPSFAPMSDDLLGFIDALDEPQRTGDTNE